MKLDFHKNHRLLFNTVFWGFVILSIIIAVVPAYYVNDVTPTPGSKPMTFEEFQGLKVYVSEGCMYCHTQQVRPLESDKMFGRPSAPGDYAYLKPLDDLRMTPAVLGSERTGPDLSNIGNRQPSEAWHYMHLYNPRSVVKTSVMQAYPWMFEIKEDPLPDDYIVSLPPDDAPKNGKLVATEDAQHLVAYLLYLKQAPIKILGVKEIASTSSNKTGLNIGESIYKSNCASCHQQNGEGLTAVFPPLKNSSVVNSDNADEHIGIVLFGAKGRTIDGVKYTSEMPAQKENYSNEEITAVINYERTSWGNKGKEITAEDVKRIRERGK
ncbi:MAG: cytochrome c [Bacteroidetes bacterium]|nr:cytochrome c [Bacteroidota bacterium]